MPDSTLHIDRIDALTTYGVRIAHDGLLQLLAYPPVKAYKSNNWKEIDGIETDIAENAQSPILNTRTVTMKFVITGTFDKLQSLIADLAATPYHTFTFDNLHRTYHLRLIAHTDLAASYHLQTLSLTLADDFPIRRSSLTAETMPPTYIYQSPQSSIQPYFDYLINGVPFTDYGIRILQGTRAEVLKTPSVKPALTRNISSDHGAYYDPNGQATFASRDAKINCLLTDTDIDRLWRNYDALLYDITRPMENSLYVQFIEKEIPFLYKSCQVSAFRSQPEKNWLMFTLTITLTDTPHETFVIGTEPTDAPTRAIATEKQHNLFLFNYRRTRHATPTS